METIEVRHVVRGLIGVYQSAFLPRAGEFLEFGSADEGAPVYTVKQVIHSVKFSTRRGGAPAVEYRVIVE